MKTFEEERLNDLNNLLFEKKADFTASYHVIHKNNNNYEALSLKNSNSPIGVNFRLFDENLEMPNYELADLLISFFKENITNLNFNSSIIDRDYILNHSFPTLVPTYSCENVKNKVIENNLSKEFLNLTILFRTSLSEDDSTTFLISKVMAEKFNISENEIFEASMKNISNKGKFTSMFDTLANLFGEDFSDGEELSKDSMYVLSFNSSMFGASMILSSEYMNKIADTIGDNFTIIPSSIHEVLIIPFHEDEDYNSLQATINEVNKTNVQLEEILSYSVYSYSKKDGVKIILE